MLFLQYTSIEEIYNTKCGNILTYLVASNMFELIFLFTKNWGRNWGIFDPFDFLKLTLNKMDFSTMLNRFHVGVENVKRLQKKPVQIS